MLRIFGLVWSSAVLVAVALGGTVASAQGAGDIPGTRLSSEAAAATIGDQFFHVEWSPAAGRHGQPRLTGYVYNDYEEPAVKVQLRIYQGRIRRAGRSRRRSNRSMRRFRPRAGPTSTCRFRPARPTESTWCRSSSSSCSKG